MSVAIMGREGSYHDIAASHLFGAAYPAQNHPDFPEVFAAVAEGSAAHGVTAIENTAIGILPKPYDLLAATPEVEVVDEIKLRIQHALAATARAGIGGIRTVYSHPAALAQCSEFLARTLPDATIKPAADTASGLAMVAESNDPTIAAIGSPDTAEEHGLRILDGNVANDPDNRTRFVVLEQTYPDRRYPGKKPDRTMLLVRNATDHTSSPSGKLQEVLSGLQTAGVSMLGMRFRPNPEPWGSQDAFIELDVGTPEQRMELAAMLLTQTETDFRVIGSYAQGRTVDAKRAKK